MFYDKGIVEAPKAGFFGGFGGFKKNLSDLSEQNRRELKGKYVLHKIV